MDRYSRVKPSRPGTTNYDASRRELTTSNFGGRRSIKRVKLQLGITGVIYADHITPGKERRRCYGFNNRGAVFTPARSTPRDRRRSRTRAIPRRRREKSGSIPAT